MRKRISVTSLALVAALTAAGDWTSYRHDADNSGHAQGPAARTQLRRGWTFRADSRITSTPTISGSLVYVGTWNGDAIALDLSSGAVKWKVHLGANPDEVYGGPRGVIASLAIAGGVAYAASGNCTVTALDAHTGARRWQRFVCDTRRNDDVYSSPVVANGTLLVGVDMLADRPTDRGREIALDAATGKIRWTFNAARYPGMGAGVSATPVVDPQTNTVYVGTGNPLPTNDPPPGPDPGSESIVALDLQTGQVRWTFGPVHPHDTNDDDFFASPNRVNLEETDRKRWGIGEGNKDATYYMVDAISGRELWRRTIPGRSGSASIIGTAAVAGNALFVPLYDGTNGSLTAIRANDGAVLWQQTTGGEYEAVLAWGTSVFTTETTGWLDEFAEGTGKLLGRWKLCGPATGRGPSAGGNGLFVAAGNCLAYFRKTR